MITRVVGYGKYSDFTDENYVGLVILNLIKFSWLLNAGFVFFSVHRKRRKSRFIFCIDFGAFLSLAQAYTCIPPKNVCFRKNEI